MQFLFFNEEKEPEQDITHEYEAMKQAEAQFLGCP